MTQNFSSVLFYYFAGLLATLFFPSFFSQCNLNFCIPILVLFIYNCDLLFCLWISLLTGFLIDCVQVSPKLGFYAFSYLAACFFLYRRRLYFFKDSLYTLPIMTYLFTLLSTLLQAVESVIFELPGHNFTAHWFFSDCLIMPFCEVFYASVVFSLVPYLYSTYCMKRRRKRSEVK